MAGGSVAGPVVVTESAGAVVVETAGAVVGGSAGAVVAVPDAVPPGGAHLAEVTV